MATKRTNIETRGIASISSSVVSAALRLSLRRYVLDCAVAMQPLQLPLSFYPYFLMRGDLKESDSHFSLHGISSAPHELIRIKLGDKRKPWLALYVSLWLALSRCILP